MKSIPRILFVFFVIGLIGFAIYMAYNNQTAAEQEAELKASETKVQIVNEMRLGIAEFDTINPILSRNKNVQDIAKIIYEPLIDFSVDFKAVPCLATEWSKVENNGYLIKLREGVKWHDGTNFTARDVKFTVDKIKSEEVNSIYKANLKNVVKLDIIDNYTIRLTLDADVPFFEYYLTFPILSDSYFAGQDFLTTSKNKNPVGTGKFKVYAEDDGSLTLNKNKDYWGISKQENTNYGLKTIHVSMFESMGELYNSFKIGNIDLIISDNLYVEDYIGTLGYNRKDIKGKDFDFIAFNLDNVVLSNPERRKAISSAIDRNSIIANIYNNKFLTAEFPLDYNNWIYKQEFKKLEYDPSQVDKAFNADGWELKNSVWRKTIDYRTVRAELRLVVNASNPTRVSTAWAIKEQLANVGIDISVIEANDEQYQSYLQNKNYDMIILGTHAPFSPNLNTYLGAGNYSNFYNEEITNLLNEAKNISDPNVFVEKYNRIYEIFAADMPFMSLFFNRISVCYSQNLMGEITPNCFNVFYNIEKWYRQY